MWHLISLFGKNDVILYTYMFVALLDCFLKSAFLPIALIRICGAYKIEKSRIVLLQTQHEFYITPMSPSRVS